VIETIIKIWPPMRRYLIWSGASSGLIAAMFWLSGVNPTFSGAMLFIGLVAFLLGAKAQDDHNS
jgi:hypothetical protein